MESGPFSFESKEEAPPISENGSSLRLQLKGTEVPQQEHAAKPFLRSHFTASQALAH